MCLGQAWGSTPHRPGLGGGVTGQEQLHARMSRRVKADPQSLNGPQEPMVCGMKLARASDQNLCQLGKAQRRHRNGTLQSHLPASSYAMPHPHPCTPSPRATENFFSPLTILQSFRPSRPSHMLLPLPGTLLHAPHGNSSPFFRPRPECYLLREARPAPKKHRVASQLCSCLAFALIPNCACTGFFTCLLYVIPNTLDRIP